MSTPRLFIIVGRRGAGKSSAVRSMFPPSMTDVWDRQQEYDLYRSFYTPDLEEAWEYVTTAENRVIIIEEASIWFSSRTRLTREMKGTIIDLRHTNNVLVFVFHAISQIPDELVSMTDCIVQYQTTDTPDTVKRKFRAWPEIRTGYEALKKAPKYSYIVHER